MDRSHDSPTDAAFEADVRAAFRRHGASLDPLVARVALPEAPPVALVPVRLAPRGRLLPGLATAVVVVAVFGAVLLGPGLVRRPAASPSPSVTPLPAQWTGLDWSRAVTDGRPAEGDLRNAAWNGGWVLASTAGLSFSADGSGWTRGQSFSQAGYVLVAPAGAGFAVTETFTDDGGGVRVVPWHSADGRAWTRGGTGAFDGQNQIWDLASGPKGLVAVGLSARGGARFDTAGFGAWFSPDGASWQRIDDPAVFGSDWPYAAAALPGGFLVGGSLDGRSTIWFSAEGRSWSRASFPGTPGWHVSAIAAGASGIVALERPLDAPVAGAFLPPGRLWRSTDGRTWSLADVAAPEYVTGDGLRITARYAAEPTDNGASASAYSVSFDGASWTQVTDERHSQWLGLSHDSVLADVDGRVYAVPATTAVSPLPQPSRSPAATPQPTPASTPSGPALEWKDGASPWSPVHAAGSPGARHCRCRRRSSRSGTQRMARAGDASARTGST